MTMLSELKYKVVPIRWYPYVYPAYRKIRQRIEKIDRALDRRTLPEARFIELLQELGFKPGATVMVHSALSRVRRRVPDLTPEKLIALLQRLVGAEGTLLMPTYSFLGSQAEYADSHTHFDVHSTPSRVGILTEIFRKLPDAVRSLHPTHSVAA